MTMTTTEEYPNVMAKTAVENRLEKEDDWDPRSKLFRTTTLDLCFCIIIAWTVEEKKDKVDTENHNNCLLFWSLNNAIAT